MKLKEIELKMNEMCDLLGISPQGIRLYEKSGAIHSFKYDGNGYRYYYFEDIAAAIQVRCLRKLGMPLSECALREDGWKPEMLHASLASCRRQIEENIRYEQALLKRMDELEKTTGKSISRINEFEECTRPAMYYLRCEENGCILGDHSRRMLIRDWSSRIPFVQFCPVVPAKELGEAVVAQIGFCFMEQDRDFAPPVDHPWVVYEPEETCIGGTVVVGKDTMDYYSVVKPGLLWMQEHGYELTGDIYTLFLASGIHSGEDILDCYYAWYPCRKREAPLH